MVPFIHSFALLIHFVIVPDAFCDCFDADVHMEHMDQCALQALAWVLMKLIGFAVHPCPPVGGTHLFVKRIWSTVTNALTNLYNLMLGGEYNYEQNKVNLWWIRPEQ